MQATRNDEPKKTTSAALTDLLREEIVSGRLPGGSRVTVGDVAARYGVSQMPVREALHRLQGEGLVAVSPHRGARVVVIDRDFVNCIYDLRGAIEALLARVSLPNLTNSAMAELHDIWEELDKAAAKNDTERFLTLIRRFHTLLYRYAGNPIAQDIYDRYVGLMQTLRRQYGFGPGRLSEIVKGLAEVVDAVRGQDAERLSQLVATQADQAKRDLLALMAQGAGAHAVEGSDATTDRLLRYAASR